MELRKIKIKNKKAAITDILVWLVISFVTVLFFALWIYGFNEITDTLTGIEGSTKVNISDAAKETFGKVNVAQTRGLHILAYVMIFIMGFSILISNFLVKSHPAFFIVYLLVIITAIIASVYLSNQYESLMTDAIVGGTISDFTGASWIMLYLPIWTAVIGIFGGIFLFAGIIRDRGMGGSVV